MRVRSSFREEGAVVEVWNDGPSIDPDDLPHVFDRFFRSDESRSRATGGAGLGLPIAKAIVEAHGGAITVESGSDQGTLFALSLPVSTEPMLPGSQDYRGAARPSPDLAAPRTSRPPD